MPFIGLSPFLRCGSATLKLENGVCQCPLSGFLHFYQQMNMVLMDVLSVNALYRAFSISTSIPGKHPYYKGCVNALYRAFSIST